MPKNIIAQKDITMSNNYVNTRKNNKYHACYITKLCILQTCLSSINNIFVTMPYILHTILCNITEVYITKEKSNQSYSNIKTNLSSVGCCKNKALTKRDIQSN